MNVRVTWMGVVAAVILAASYAVGCASSQGGAHDAWCCDLTAAGWSCTAECTTAYCPAGVASQERCSSAEDAGCSFWSCDDAGSFLDAGKFSPPPPPPIGTFGSVAPDATSGDAPPPASPDATSGDAPPAASPDAAAPTDAIVGVVSTEASPLPSPEEAGHPESGPSATPCAPDSPCDGLSSCADTCWSASCCTLSCTCQDPYGGAGNPTDPSARLVCQASCP